MAIEFAEFQVCAMVFYLNLCLDYTFVNILSESKQWKKAIDHQIIQILSSFHVLVEYIE